MKWLHFPKEARRTDANCYTALNIKPRRGGDVPVFTNWSVGGHTYLAGKTECAFNEMETDYIVPWHNGGNSDESNCQTLCKYHNGRKSGE